MLRHRQCLCRGECLHKFISLCIGKYLLRFINHGLTSLHCDIKKGKKDLSSLGKPRVALTVQNVRLSGLSRFQTMYHQS